MQLRRLSGDMWQIWEEEGGGQSQLPVRAHTVKACVQLHALQLRTCHAEHARLTEHTIHGCSERQLKPSDATHVSGQWKHASAECFQLQQAASSTAKVMADACL